MSGRTALVPGANRGIGREIVRQLAAGGMRVVLAARDPVLGEEAARHVPGEVLVERLDVADQASVDTCAMSLANAGVQIDVLVNNAGLYTTTPLLEIDERRLLESVSARPSRRAISAIDAPSSSR